MYLVICTRYVPGSQCFQCQPYGNGTHDGEGRVDHSVWARWCSPVWSLSVPVRFSPSPSLG